MNEVLVQKRYLLIGAICVAIVSVFGLSALVFAQSPNDVIINEYNEGSGNCAAPEWVESLVINGPITMRNWVLTDKDADDFPSGGSEGRIEFADDPVFDNIPIGTYIVVSIGPGTDDTDPSDRVMSLFTENSLLSVTGSFNLSAAGDNIGLYTSTSGNAIDHIAYGNHAGPIPEGLTWSSNIGGPSIPEDEDAYFSDGTNFNNDDASKWVIDADGGGCQDRTIGAANPNQNDFALPVELSLFTATATEAGTILSWETASETNNLGFWIYRGDRRNGEYIRVNPVMIRGAGTSGAPHTYEFTDTDVEEGTHYYYYIEDVAFDGSTVQSPIVQTQIAIGPRGRRLIPWGQLKRD